MAGLGDCLTRVCGEPVNPVLAESAEIEVLGIGATGIKRSETNPFVLGIYPYLSLPRTRFMKLFGEPIRDQLSEFVVLEPLAALIRNGAVIQQVEPMMRHNRLTRLAEFVPIGDGELAILISCLRN
ncbi:hypothetical protein Q3C01_18365 [Bradyrhizobium sp. UFLA05-109]